MTGIMEKLQTIRFNMRTRILITAIFLVGALIVMAVGVFAFQISKSDAERLSEEIQGELDRANDVRFIFGNNLIHTLVMFVPVVGPIWGGIVLFSTGTVITTISVAQGVPPIVTFLVLFLVPIFWLEIGVYSVAMAQSFVWFAQILRGRGKKEAARTCILVTICASVLLLSAVFEWALINISTSSLA